MQKRYPLLLVAAILMTGCSKNDDLSIPSLAGEYQGIFTVSYLAGSETFSNPVTINFSDGRFTSSAGENRRPAGGSGTFEVTEQSVVFADENIWTADFDWNLVLNGEYTLIETNTQLILRAIKNEVGVYTYTLTK